MCSCVCVVCLWHHINFLCTVFVSQFGSTCMDRPPLIVCTTHLHTMKSYLKNNNNKGDREGGRETGRETGREGDREGDREGGREGGVSGFSGMGIVEWWNGGMVERWNSGMDFFLIHFVCLFVYSMA